MPSLIELPSETLISILQHLWTCDVVSLLTSQRTCKRFRNLIQVLLQTPPKGLMTDSRKLPDPRINPMLLEKFGRLFYPNEEYWVNDESMDKLSRFIQRPDNAYFSMDHDIRQPFRQLHWARSQERREPFLRHDASWRQLSVTADTPTITHLELVKQFTVYGGTSMKYLRVELPPCGLTMGLFYDLLLTEGCTFGHATSRWELLLGKRLPNLEALPRIREARKYISQKQVEKLLVSDGSAKQSAILYVTGGRGCVVHVGVNHRISSECWEPTFLGDAEVKLQPLDI